MLIRFVGSLKSILATTSVATGLATTTTIRLLLLLAVLGQHSLVLLLPGEQCLLTTSVSSRAPKPITLFLALPTVEDRRLARVRFVTLCARLEVRILRRHLSFTHKNYALRLRGSLDEVNLQERLEVQVRHLILVANAEELRERGVREDTALERRVEARVRLDVLADELRHLRLRARLTRLEAHEVAQLIRQRALNQEGVVRTALLVGGALLLRHRRRVNLLLLLGVAGLALGRLRRLLNGADGITDLRAQLRAERLELLGERRELGLRRRRRGGRLRRGGSDNRHRHLRLSGRGGLRGLGRLGDLGLGGGLRGLGGGGGGNRGGDGGNGLRGILLGGRHLV